MYYTWGYLKENTLSKLNIGEEEANQLGFLSRFPYMANEAMTQICSAIKPKQAYFEFTVTEAQLNTRISMPEDFLVFSDDVAEFKLCNHFVEVGDDLLAYDDDNHVVCKKRGIYRVPYSARWFFFTKDLQNADVITAPADVLDALPSYMASQCLKIDDESKAAIFRNEYEMFLARINNTAFKRQRTFTIGGNW